MEGRNVGTKMKSPKQEQTSAEDLMLHDYILIENALIIKFYIIYIYLQNITHNSNVSKS